MRRALAALALLCAPLGAAGQGAQVDAGEVAACLAATPVGATYPACLGAQSDICQQAPGGGTTIGIADCIAAETAAWDALLNDAYRALISAIAARPAGAGDATAEDLTAALRDAQRAWIGFRDADCALRYAQNQGGTIRSIVHANCLLGMTAARTVDLRDMAGH